MIRRKRRTKYNEAREVPKPKVIKWQDNGDGAFKGALDGYLLYVTREEDDSWYWVVYLGIDNIAYCKKGETKNSAQKAKNAAVFQMTKHKNSLIRKTVNS